MVLSDSSCLIVQYTNPSFIIWSNIYNNALSNILDMFLEEKGRIYFFVTIMFSWKK